MYSFFKTLQFSPNSASFFSLNLQLVKFWVKLLKKPPGKTVRMAK